MRRMIFVFLVVVGILALGVRFFVNERLTSENFFKIHPTVHLEFALGSHSNHC